MTKAEQKAMDIKAFQLRVKCCWNCPHWKKHKADAICYCDLRHGFVKTAWDYWCEDYSGFAIEKNLLVSPKKGISEGIKTEEGRMMRWWLMETICSTITRIRTESSFFCHRLRRPS